MNTYFLRWLRKIIGPANYSILDHSLSGQRFGTNGIENVLMRKLLQNFESEKRVFSTKSRAVKLELPSGSEGYEGLDTLTVPGYVDSGLLTIPP